MHELNNKKFIKQLNQKAAPKYLNKYRSDNDFQKKLFKDYKQNYDYNIQYDQNGEFMKNQCKLVD